ncbi:hypothetical protein GCM10009662_85160 [Catellatospora coxensis]
MTGRHRGAALEEEQRGDEGEDAEDEEDDAERVLRDHQAEADEPEEDRHEEEDDGADDREVPRDRAGRSFADPIALDRFDAGRLIGPRSTACGSAVHLGELLARSPGLLRHGGLSLLPALLGRRRGTLGRGRVL